MSAETPSLSNKRLNRDGEEVCRETHRKTLKRIGASAWGVSASAAREREGIMRYITIGITILFVILAILLHRKD